MDIKPFLTDPHLMNYVVRVDITEHLWKPPYVRHRRFKHIENIPEEIMNGKAFLIGFTYEKRKILTIHIERDC